MRTARTLLLLITEFGFSIGQTDYVTDFLQIEDQFSGQDSIAAKFNYFNQLSDTRRICLRIPTR